MRDWRRGGALLVSAAITEQATLELATIILLAAGAPEPVKIVTSEFELKPPARPLRVTPQDCRREAAAGEIVVCGRSPDAYRAQEIKVPKGMEIDEGGIIGFDVGGARVEPSLSQVGMPDGRISKRLMMKVKVPF